jgi:shikimate kinase
VTAQARPAGAVKARPLVVELVGPWGAGKGTFIASLAAAGDRSLRLGLGVWTLPRLLLLVGSVQLLPTLLRLYRAARRILWQETKQLIKLRALHHQLRLQRFTRHRVVVLDEGPVFALSWLHSVADRAATNGGLAAWWPDALRQWARTLDLVIVLDAPNPVLAERIRLRERDHPLKHTSDPEVAESLDRYRAACERVLSDLQAQDGGPTVLTFRTDQESPERIADRLLAAYEVARRGR